MIKEIVRSNPDVSIVPQGARRWNYHKTTEVGTFYDALQKEGITTETHPLALDLATGDGTYARLLVDRGWNPANITCVDYSQSPTPLVRGCTWLYWDLVELYESLRRNATRFPREIANLRGSFDLVIFQGCYIPEGGICDFFVRPNGYYYHHSWLAQKQPESR